MSAAFQQCFSNLPEATLLVSAQGRILEANSAAVEMLRIGVPLKGNVLSELVLDAPEKTSRYLEVCRRTRDLSPGSLTFKNGKPDGIACRVEGALFEATPEGGLLILRLSSKGEATRAFRTLNERIDALNREVTERRRTEALLYAQQEWLRATLISIGDAVIATDVNAKITFLNEVAESLTGWTQEEAKGKPIDKIFVITNEETGAPVENPVPKALREGRVVGLANHTNLTAKDGSQVPIDDSAAPIRDVNGNVTGVVLVFRNIAERKQAEKAGQLLRAIVDSSADAIISKNLDGTITSWNKSAERLFGYTAEEMVGKPVTILIPPDRLDEEPKIIERLKESMRVDYIETRRVRKDGTELDISLTISPVLDANGRIIGASKIARDITERKRIEKHLHDSERQLRSMVDSIDQLAWMANAEGWIYWYNKRWYEYTGATPAEMEGWGWQSVHDPKILPEVMEKWSESIRTGQPFDMIFPLKGADGVFRPFLTRINPVSDHDGNVWKWFGTNTDIDALSRAEATARESEERFRALADNIPQLAWIADAGTDGQVHWFNENWFRYTGTTLEEMRGSGWHTVHHPDHAERVIQNFAHHVQANLDWEDTFPLRGQDGNYRWFLSRMKCIRDESGQVARIFGTNTDITEQRAMELELRRANQDLESFAYSASHDLQEPLRMIAIYSQMLVNGYKDKLEGEAEMYVRMITDGTRRMRELLADLLAYTAVDAQATDDTETIDLNLIFEEVIKNSKVAIEESAAMVSSDPLPIICGHRAHFVQLFQNLISNGIKYRSKRSPRIHVSAEQQNGSWRFAVTDNGMGIAPEHHEKIFGVFKRLHGKTIPGTGIGLAICQRVVERYQGRLWVESESDKGATFFFTVPIGSEVRKVSA